MENVKKSILSHGLFITIILISLFGINSLKKSVKYPVLEIPLQDSTFNIQRESLLIMSAGFQRMISSWMYFYTLLTADEKHYKGEAYRSWLFQRFLNIVSLDPKFYEGYLYGGLYLSIIKNDPLAAEIIYDKGIEAYPEDLRLVYNAGFNAYYELGDHQKGIRIFKSIAKLPGVHKKLPLLGSTLSKMASSSGNLEGAYLIVKNAYAMETVEKFKMRYRVQLYALKAELDLKCLNSSDAKDCSLRDQNGESYLRNSSGSYYAKTAWKPHRINIPKHIQKRRAEQKRLQEKRKKNGD
ncbi:MAG: hypothetical protein HN509_00320 [Halobacteriovoraceae bacterium]|jgi:hypothetical protein|nr:hypothetical protein [Halobacteriovoraceae bacterium]MBT5093502.1 hypothetical protein [Halobacteriovoraceae bacterium]